MPELPEVEVVRRSLKLFIKGLKIKKVTIFNKNLRYKIAENLPKSIKNSRIIFIKRRSKFLLLGLENSNTILIHLGMTGKIFILNNYSNKIFNPNFYYQKEIKNKHDHLEIEFNKSIKIIYNDIRKFGFIKLVTTDQISKNEHLINLGPEPLNKEFNINYFNLKTRNLKKNVKNLLLDQKIISGIGNIYSNEILHLSSIDPRKISKSLKAREKQNIVKNTKAVLLKAIKFGGSSIRDFEGISGKTGNFQHEFMVYNRDGQLCRKAKCIGKIKKIYISNRSTFYCSKCQR